MSSIRFVSTRLSGAAAMALAACAGEETAANDDASSAASASAAHSAALPVGGRGGDRDRQTPQAGAAPAGATPITMETVADGLAHPWGLAWLPNGDMLISERAGRLRVVRDGALVAEPIAGTPPALVDNQAGYFDVLPHPDFSENNVLYLAYAHGTKDENALRIVRGQFDGASLNDLETIYEATPLKDTSHHFGGKMAWGPAGKLYFTIGEGSRYKERAQMADTSFGAVVRLNEDGTIPDDNPTWPVEGA